MDTVRELMRRGNKTLLGTMLQALLLYLDHPFMWSRIGYWERTPGGGKAFVPVTWRARHLGRRRGIRGSARQVRPDFHMAVGRPRFQEPSGAALPARGSS